MVEEDWWFEGGSGGDEGGAKGGEVEVLQNHGGVFKRHSLPPTKTQGSYTNKHNFKEDRGV